MTFKSPKDAGIYLAKQKQYTDALPHLIQALEDNPIDCEVLYSLATVKAADGDLENAQALCERVLQLEPTHYRSCHLLGAVSAFCGNYYQAEYFFDRSLNHAPNMPSAKWNKAQCELLRGDYKNGFESYRFGRQAKINHVRAFGKEWDGSPVDTLFVWAEQGLGEVLMMARFIPEIAKRAKHVIFEVYKPLVPLFDAQNWGVSIVAQPEDWHNPYNYDAQVSIMDLPRLCGVESPKDVKGKPYLTIPEGFKKNAGKTGICWKGSHTHENDAQRSLKPEDLEPLKKFPFVSFQKDETLFKWEPQKLNDFAQTAQALEGLELLVTVDTSVAHLAGACGIPTWLVVPLNKEWRWGTEGEKTCWYDSVRVFRPTLETGFSPVIHQIAKELNGILKTATVGL